jgi:hypothetical protein
MATALTPRFWIDFCEARQSIGDRHQVIFGGESQGICVRCSRPLLRIAVIERPIAVKLGITARARVELVSCGGCVGWEGGELFFQHDDDGSAVAFAANEDDEAVEPESNEDLGLERDHLDQMVVELAAADAASSTGCERIGYTFLGGSPHWLQSAHRTSCARCRRRMRFVGQFDSELPSGSDVN